MIFSSLSSSSFFCLGIILVIIGILGYLISRKFQEQNHKITTMCELVTTMAQDLQMLKMQNAVDKIQHTLHTQSVSSGGGAGGDGGSGTLSQVTPLQRTVDLLGYPEDTCTNYKIVVSDDDGSYEDSDDEDDDSERDDNSTLEEFQPDVFDEEEDDDDDDNIEVIEMVEPTVDFMDASAIATASGEFSMDTESVEILMDDLEPVETKHIDLSEPVALIHTDPHPEPSPIVVNKLAADQEPETEMEVLEEDNPTTHDTSATSATVGNTTAATATKPKKPTKQSRSSVSEEGAIENMEDFTGDYSKLNVTQLRNLVTYRGLSSHASKLKKTELLQLLGGGAATSVLELLGNTAEVDV